MARGDMAERDTAPVIGVLVSGEGTNLQALLDHFASAARDVGRVELVVANRSGIGALARKLLVALWHYLRDGVIPAGATLKPAGT